MLNKPLIPPLSRSSNSLAETLEGHQGTIRIGWIALPENK